ncbi:hypothetical protein D3C87_1675960 [compost metagenome]
MKKSDKQSNAQAGMAIAGGLLFLCAAAAEVLFLVVYIVMLVQNDSPSIGIIIGPAVVMLVGWGMVRLGKEKLGSALSQITNHLS